MLHRSGAEPQRSCREDLDWRGQGDASAFANPASTRARRARPASSSAGAGGRTRFERKSLGGSLRSHSEASSGGPPECTT
eukprot:13117888-Heterocapsa_arctica.AAC.1